MVETTCKVLIVGAGPVGLTMASELARYGVPVRIVDKAASRTDKSKALVLWSRTLELLDRAGCTEKFVAAGQRVLAANIVAGGEQIGHISIEGIASPYPFALMLPQSDTERLLEEHLQSLGVSVEREVELSGFTVRDDGVDSVLRHPDGREETFATDWMIGCDGAHSTVRHALSFEFHGSTLKSDWILGDLHLTGFPYPESEIVTYWHKDGVLVAFPTSPGRYRVIADHGVSEGALPADPTLEEVQSVIDQRAGGGITVSDPIWLAGFRINERKVTEYRKGRVFLAGDAAHVHSPAGGQGMNTGMQDAFNLAWKLALVCRGDCSHALLVSYSAERSLIGDQVLENAGRLTALAVMRNPVAQAVRNFVGHIALGLAPFRQSMVDSMAEISIGYPKSPISGPGTHGARVAPCVGQTPVGSGVCPRFALFADPSEEALGLLTQFATLIEPTLRPPLEAGKASLVRPDGYMAWIADANELHPIQWYLETFFLKE